MSAATSHPTNLPATFTSFVGRRHEIASVSALLGTARLLTLTGAGGVGKTRLAREVAAASAKSFPGGVWLVDLAPVREPGAVASVVAGALRVPELGTQDPLERLKTHLADPRALIVLDNCEHLAAVCADLTQTLLSAAPELRILATSRHTLGVTGEHVFVTPPMSLEEAAELLRERVAAVRPEFRVDSTNQEQVTQLCADLDGLPLAIELAAFRLRSLTVAQVTERLEDRFALLASGSRTALPQQRTLRGMIEWSYELCAPAERLLWNRLSVFAGGFSLDAAEGSCAGEHIAKHEVLDLLDRLVVQSVVLTTETEGLLRYQLLETIRQYGREQLAQSGEEEKLLRRHQAFFLAMAQHIDDHWHGPGQAEALARLRAEHTNLLAALDYEADPQARLALAAALCWHWCADGFLSDGRRLLERVLAAAPEPTPARTRAALAVVWVTQTQGDFAAADRWLDEADALAEQLDDPWARTQVDGLRGVSAYYRGRPEECISRYEKAWATMKALGAEREATSWQLALTCAQAYAGEPRVQETGKELIATAEASGERWGRAQALMALGYNAWALGDRVAAEARVRSALQSIRGFNDYTMVARMLILLAWATCSRGDHERAARLLGAAKALWPDSGTAFAAFGPLMAERHARCEEDVIGVLGKASYVKAFTEGGLYDSPGLAIEYALGGDLDSVAPYISESPLTAREREVAGLVAQGMTNRQIASALGVSPRTADRHVQNILSKLNFRSRSQVASWWTTRQLPTSLDSPAGY